MLKEIIRCDIEREIDKRKKAKEELTGEVNTNAQIEELVQDIQKKMKTIRTPIPDNVYLTVFDGPVWKVFIKRCVRKLTWWFIDGLSRRQHWRNEMTAASIEFLTSAVELMSSQIRSNEVKIQELETQLAEKQEKDEDISNFINYEDFENKFRGSDEEVKNRIKRYLEWFSTGQEVLDLGCGRGDLLEVFSEAGMSVFGVDLDARSIQTCKQKGLKVAHCDMFAYLERLEDESLDGIVSLQVIEHITPVQLAKLVEICYKKLKKNGILILETQNPKVLYTMLVYFYVDPTHIRPVHPMWLEYLLKNYRFRDIVLDYPEYSIQYQYAQAHFLVDEHQEDANRRVDVMNDLLFGPTDYAAIAKK